MSEWVGWQEEEEEEEEEEESGVFLHLYWYVTSLLSCVQVPSFPTLHTNTCSLSLSSSSSSLSFC